MIWTSGALGQESKASIVTKHPGQEVEQSPVVATIGGVEIRLADVDAYIGHEVDELAKRLYLLRHQALNSMIDTMVVKQQAEREHTDASTLLQRKVKESLPSKEEIDREWSNNYESLRALGEVAGRYQVAMELQNHARTVELREYLDELRTQQHVAILLVPPEVKLRARPGDNQFGNLHGSRELTIFQDYECPFCRQLEPRLSQLLDDPQLSDLKVTIKQFPLSMHRGAFSAAVAAECAGQQQKFAPMHELLIANQDHSSEGLLATAKQAGLDPIKFDGCMAAGDAKARVVNDMDEARKNGVEGTPTLFLDGGALEMPGTADDLRKILEAKLRPVGQTSDRLQGAPGGK